jgi:hypothetical protein
LTGDRAYAAVYRARNALVLACVEAFGATASNKELAYLSGLMLDRVKDCLRHLEQEGRITRQTLGNKRRITIAGPRAKTGAVERPGRTRANPSYRKTPEEIAKLPANKRPGKRRCLTCRKDFPSEHAGERICPACKPTVNSRASGFD